jgi:hypothetical protein
MPPTRGRSNLTERNKIKIGVATINIFNPVGEENQYRRKKIEEKLSTIGADVICLQESVRELEIPYFTEVYTDGPGPYELVSLFIRKDSIWNEEESIPIHTTSCPTKRTNFITTLCLKANPEIKVKIGNVHLCGGSIDEEEDTYENYIKDQDKVDVIKREILTQMVKKKSDIILGDFNSDEKGTNIPFLTSQQSWEEHDAINWNSSPINYLLEEKYTRVNDNPFYTSCYGGTPDMIWYNANKVSYGDGTMNIIDMGAKYNAEKICVTDLSDHNGIYAEFTINKDLTSSRSIRNVKNGGKYKKKTRKYKRKTRKYKRKNRKTNKK